AAPGVIMGQVVPGRAAWRIILTHRAPLSLREVRAEQFPLHKPCRILGKALFFGIRFHVTCGVYLVTSSRARFLVGLTVPGCLSPPHSSRSSSPKDQA